MVLLEKNVISLWKYNIHAQRGHKDGWLLSVDLSFQKIFGEECGVRG